MQLYAFDSDESLISAHQAKKQRNYYCLECRHMVRLRGGPYRQSHFYHLEPTPSCRQHQKGAIHLQLQSYFVQKLPAGDCHLECRFPLIQRIADVAWLSKKIIFEIQYSAIPVSEVLERTRDYQEEGGWRVVWILHDHRFNQGRLSAAEIALRSSPHFFSNMNHLGQGMIYDQFDLHDEGLRKGRLPPLPIDISQPQRQDLIKASSWPLKLLAQRADHWSLAFEGDLMTLFLKSPSSSYLKEALEREKYLDSSSLPWTWRYLPLKLWRGGIVTPYQIFFRFLLERMCR